MRPPQRERDYVVPTANGPVRVTRRPHSRGSNLADQSQPSVIVSGVGIHEIVGRWTLLCGVPTRDGGTTTLNAIEATPEQIVWAITHDESIYANQGDAT